MPKKEGKVKKIDMAQAGNNLYVGTQEKTPEISSEPCCATKK
jgi:hypothetical protein